MRLPCMEYQGKRIRKCGCHLRFTTVASSGAYVRFGEFGGYAANWVVSEPLARGTERSVQNNAGC